jgi:methionyl-tRNA synthetase
MDQALELLPGDYWRWYLLANAPESDDASFTWQLFGDAVNKDLVGTFGNFVNRTATQVTRLSGDAVPTGGAPGDVEEKLVAEIRSVLEEYVGCLDRLEFRKAAAALRSLWAVGNAYLEEREPWRAVKTDRDLAAMTLRTALGLARIEAVASSPFVPVSSQSLRGILPDLAGEELVLSPDLADEVLAVPEGSRFAAPPLLFRKLAPEEIDEWEQRFGGPEDADPEG